MKTIIVVAGVFLGTTGIAAAFPGLGGGGATAADIDGFLQDAHEAQDLVTTSSWHIATAVLAKDKLDVLIDRRKAVTAIADPKERDAKQKLLDKELQAEIAKVDYEAQAKKMEHEKDEQKKSATRAGVFNFTLGVVKDTDLLERGRKLVSGTPSPMVATKLGSVREILSSLSDQMGSFQKTLGGMQQLATATGLKALPTKASEKPQAVKAD